MVDKPKRPRRYIPYGRIAQFIDGIAPELRAQGFSSVVGIMRGGIFPAQCASHATGMPLFFIRYERVGSVASWVGDPPPPGKVLLCEDVAGMGVTLSTCQDFLRRTHASHEVLAIASDELSRVQPRWSLRFDGAQVVFPWERHVAAPKFMAHWSSGGAAGDLPMAMDHEYRLFAVVLDGVLCAVSPDGSPLASLDGVSWAPWAPKIDPSDAIVLTERPSSQGAMVQDWLALHGWSGVQVIHVAALAGIDASQAKAAWAEELGCSDLIEACPVQALLASESIPHARVTWWREGSPVLVSAAPSAGI